MGRLALISLGGALGTAARYLLSVWLLRTLGPAFPYGTLAVNVIGSFLLGVIMQAGLDTTVLSPTARVVLGTGVMGGFTTYSTFNYDAPVPAGGRVGHGRPQRRHHPPPVPRGGRARRRRSARPVGLRGRP